SELTAMRASGISFYKLLIPFLIVSVLMSVLVIWNGEKIAPDASVWSERLDESSFKTSVSQEKKNLQHIAPVTGRTWVFSSVDPSTEETMARPSGPVEIRQEKDGMVVSGVHAKRAEYLDGVWWFHELRKIEYDIDGQELPMRRNNSSEVNAPKIAAMYKLTETPRSMMLEYRNWEFYSLADMYRQLITLQIKDNGKWFEFWYRIASPWSCVVITIFAIPAGISTGRQSVMKGIIIALAAFFSFYALTLALKFFAYHSTFPAIIAALLPNVVFLSLGGVMFSKQT
ncbi:MAG: YjgP/YjgQ family permease, partial [Lentisphaerae bacterium]|nr:YjgP/YjgQ family permease [Lentisphaerota bacterium]